MQFDTIRQEDMRKLGSHRILSWDMLLHSGGRLPLSSLSPKDLRILKVKFVMRLALFPEQ